MPMTAQARKKSSLLGCAAMAVFTVGVFGNIAEALADDGTETVVVTGTRFDTDSTPAKASLETTEPQTIINRPFIEDYTAPQDDYTTILAITPGFTSNDSNGPGLADGASNTTLRGQQDGNFVEQYDGIPFGDTNGPTHHNISYFPGSTIGSIVVDRGPGNAGNLGAATYGGTVKMFSEALGDSPEAKGLVSYGSFGTLLGVLNGQSGDLDFLGTTKVLINLQDLQSNGALTFNDVYEKNALLKIENQIAPNWTLTLFGDYSHLYENLDDNNGATPAQIAVYGKNFALQNTNPNLPTYYAYNYTTKETDMDYFRENGDITNSLKLENTTYTYAYWNHTFSPNNQTQTLSDIEGDTSEGNLSLNLLNGTTDSNGILAYSKQNAYRVYGDILRISQDYDFGWISGEIRAGLWWETQQTHRFKYYYDAIACGDDNIDPITAGDEVAAAACGVDYKAGKKSILLGVQGDAKDDEHSSWDQYEPFLEIDIKPTENLTLTPGVKYIHWDHGVDAAVEQGTLCGVGLNNSNSACPNAPGQNYMASFITRDVLPFFQVNYKIDPTWSVYAEYAQGIYVPDIGTFEAGSAGQPTSAFPAAETTTNYQVGTVYYADNFNFDADVYYIPVSNNYVSNPCTYDASETCFFNTGTAVYEGIEGEGTYAFDELFGFDLHGLSVFANGDIMSSKSEHLWLLNAPAWTAAWGFLYKHDGWTAALIEKYVGPEYSDDSETKEYEMHSWSDLTARLGYGFGMAEVSVSIDNLLDTRPVTYIIENDSPYQTDRMDSTDQYFFQSPRSAMLTLKVHY
jgi:iron complex outermembrane receptor protein